MAKTTAKQPAPPELPPVTDFDLESAIADSLLDDIDWQRVRTAIIQKAKAKFVEMFFGNGSDRILPISPFPELAVLPSSNDDEGKAA